MVEGHTDDVPMKGAGEIKDNWDLSVIRATSVTKIVLASAKIESQRITAAGRGEFFPLDPCENTRSKKEKPQNRNYFNSKIRRAFKGFRKQQLKI